MSRTKKVTSGGRWSTAREITDSISGTVAAAVAAAIGAVVTFVVESWLGVAPPQWARGWRLAAAAVTGGAAGAFLVNPILFLWNVIRGRRVAAEQALNEANDRIDSLSSKLDSYHSPNEEECDVEFSGHWVIIKSVSGDYMNFVGKNVSGCALVLRDCQVINRSRHPVVLSFSLWLPGKEGTTASNLILDLDQRDPFGRYRTIYEDGLYNPVRINPHDKRGMTLATVNMALFL